MNVTKLITELEKIQKVNPRAEVYVDADTVTSPDYSHGLVNSVLHEKLAMTDGDGSRIENQDGTDHAKMVVVLSGH